MHLSLDLDETLISSVRSPIPERKPDFLIPPYVAYKRPGVDEFLDWAYSTFTSIGIYTTATKSYADVVIENVFAGRPLSCAFTRHDCVEYDPDGSPMDGGYSYYNKQYYKDVVKVLAATKSCLPDLYIVDDKIDVYAQSVVRHGKIVVARRYEIHNYRNLDENGLLMVRHELETLLRERK